MALTAGIPQLVSEHLIARLDRNLVYASLGDRSHEQYLRNAGNSVDVIDVGDITINDYTAGNTLTYVPPSTTKKVLTLNRAKSFSFRLDDLDEAALQPNIIAAQAERAASQVAEEIDDDVREFLTTTSTTDKVVGARLLNNDDSDIFASDAQSASIDLGDLANTGISKSEYDAAAGVLIDAVGTARQVLGLGNRDMGMITMVASPVTVSALTRMAFNNAGLAFERQGEDIRRNGFAGRFMGVDVRESPGPWNASDQYDDILIMHHPRCFAFASRLGGMPEVMRDPNTHGTLVRGLVQYGYTLIDGNCLFQIRQAYSGFASFSTIT